MTVNFLQMFILIWAPNQFWKCLIYKFWAALKSGLVIFPNKKGRILKNTAHLWDGVWHTSVDGVPVKSVSSAVHPPLLTPRRHIAVSQPQHRHNKHKADQLLLMCNSLGYGRLDLFYLHTAFHR